MSGVSLILLGVLFFTVIVLALVIVILSAKKVLVSTGDVKLMINDSKSLTVPAGGKLLECLANNKCLWWRRDVRSMQSTSSLRWRRDYRYRASSYQSCQGTPRLPLELPGSGQARHENRSS
jgi:hypothetical protein